MKPKTNIPCSLEYRYYNLPVDFPIFALLGERWFLPDEEITFLHFHNCLEIGICHKGTGYFLIEDQQIPFSDGDIAIVYQNTIHRSKSDDGTISYWEYLYIDTERIIEDFYPNGFPNHEFFLYQSASQKNIIHHDQNPFLHMLVKNILEEMRLEKENYKECVRGLCLALFTEIIRANAQDNVDDSQGSTLYLSIMPAISYIDKHYMQAIKMQDLADMCSLSLTHFRRLFQMSMHTSPLEYLNRVRIRRSCILLHNTEKSILDISLEVGFPSISSYNRQFQRILKTSPLKWRSNSRFSHRKDYTYSVFDF